jgi:hypothetical protein
MISPVASLRQVDVVIFQRMHFASLSKFPFLSQKVMDVDSAFSPGSQKGQPHQLRLGVRAGVLPFAGAQGRAACASPLSVTGLR